MDLLRRRYQGKTIIHRDNVRLLKWYFRHNHNNFAVSGDDHGVRLEDVL